MATATTIVDHGDEIQVTAEIESLDQLFGAPDFDPFSEQPRTSAVVDDIIAHLRSRHMRRPPAVSLTLLLPPGESPGVRRGGRGHPRGGVPGGVGRRRPGVPRAG